MLFRNSLSLLTLCAPALLLAAQAPPAANSPAPSAILQPSLEILRTALLTVHIERWNASNAVRDDAQSNVDSIQRDMQSTLPSLLATTDAAPASAAKILPVYRNVEALYDVVLRVDTAARLAAPIDQTSALDQALTRLDDSRRALGDQLQQTAAAQEAQIVRLQAALNAVPPPAPPPPQPIPVKCPATPVHKKKPTTAAKPATPPAISTPSH